MILASNNDSASQPSNEIGHLFIDISFYEILYKSD